MPSGEKIQERHDRRKRQTRGVMSPRLMSRRDEKSKSAFGQRSRPATVRHRPSTLTKPTKPDQDTDCSFSKQERRTDAPPTEEEADHQRRLCIRFCALCRRRNDERTRGGRGRLCRRLLTETHGTKMCQSAAHRCKPWSA